MLTAAARDELMQLRDALHAVRQLGGGQLPAALVLDLDVVVVLRPVITDQQQQALPVCISPPVQPAEGAARGLTDPVSAPHSAGTPPRQRSGLPADQQGHGLTSEVERFMSAHLLAAGAPSLTDPAVPIRRFAHTLVDAPSERRPAGRLPTRKVHGITHKFGHKFGRGGVMRAGVSGRWMSCATEA